MDFSLIITPEIKEALEEITYQVTCYYEGCGAGDGWPEVMIM